MKTSYLFLFFLTFEFDLIVFSQDMPLTNVKCNNERLVKDTIPTIKIGQQVWMSENLNVMKFRNGDTIREVRTNKDWKEACENGIPAWCYYENDPKNEDKYGKIYNWYAINDERDLSPEGFHILNEVDLGVLSQTLSNEDSIPDYFSQTYEKDSLIIFPLLFVYRYQDGTFSNLNDGGIWFSHQKNSSLSEQITAYQVGYKRGLGIPVRCLKE